MTLKIASIGEAMLELTHQSPRTLTLGFAGDTLNTAVYLSRLAGNLHQIDYVTRVARDWYSDELLAAIQGEGIDTSLIVRTQSGNAGLYLVRTDTAGERTFTYYRSSSVARGLFGPDQGPELDEHLAGYDIIYLSAISLQILTPGARQRLWTLMERVRSAGGSVIFDSNYRSAGWTTPDEARFAIEETLKRTDIALPTYIDEAQLYGDSSPEATAHRIHGLGVPEIVVKDGRDDCVVRLGNEIFHEPALPVQHVVDTTGAGDAFNAGYINARLGGIPPQHAAAAGHRIAAQVIQMPGAIIPHLKNVQMTPQSLGQSPAAGTRRWQH
ncbi:sugar kinase [Arthrobacter sp. M2012083]|uniref:sugar kinase n=1 Tax=Arthrobacter sp. M2012083 TaxID=1197706 RepID=UPI0002D7F2D9|nr:sugar kinase [Arthrobacter sp. M2012083]